MALLQARATSEDGSGAASGSNAAAAQAWADTQHATSVDVSGLVVAEATVASSNDAHQVAEAPRCTHDYPPCVCMSLTQL